MPSISGGSEACSWSRKRGGSGKSNRKEGGQEVSVKAWELRPVDWREKGGLDGETFVGGCGDRVLDFGNGQLGIGFAFRSVL